MFGWLKKNKSVQLIEPSRPRFDMHNHLLPGVDDGCQSEDDMFACVEGLIALGYRGAVMTPHIWQELFPNEEDALRERFAALRPRLAERFPQFAVRLGAEYMLDEFLMGKVQDEPDSLLTFGPGGRCLLVELPVQMMPVMLDEFISDAVSRGLTPIIAHVERYAYVQEDEDNSLVERWSARQAALQVNLASLSGSYGQGCQKAAERLLQTEHVRYLGTDLHNPGQLSGQRYTHAWNTVEQAPGCYDADAQETLVAEA